MHVNASSSRNAPIYFCGDNGHSNTVNSSSIDALVWGYMVRLADEIALIEKAIQLATNNAGNLHEIAAIEKVTVEVNELGSQIIGSSHPVEIEINQRLCG